MDLVDEAQKAIESAEVRAVEEAIPSFEDKLLRVLTSIRQQIAENTQEIRRLHSRMDEMEAQAASMMDPSKLADMFGGFRG